MKSRKLSIAKTGEIVKEYMKGAGYESCACRLENKFVKTDEILMFFSNFLYDAKTQYLGFSY